MRRISADWNWCLVESILPKAIRIAGAFTRICFRSSIENPAIILIFLGALFYSFWAVNIGWKNTILDLHGFRQTQTAISTYYMLKGGNWVAYETPVLGAPWAIPFEFPLYQWIVALLVKLLDTPLDQTGRFVSVSFFYLTLIPAYAMLATFGISKVHRLVFLSLFLLCPLYLFWSRAFMIESTALFFGMAFLASAAISLKRQNWKFIVLACLCAVLGALIKITTFVGFALAAALLVLHSWRERYGVKLSLAAVKKYVIPLFAFALVPLFISTIWTKYTDSLKALNPLASFITSQKLIRWNFGTYEQRISDQFWGDAIYDRIIPALMGSKPAFWLVIAMVAYWGWRKLPQAIPFSLSTFLFLSVMLIFTNLHIVHDYYQYANGIFLISAVGFFIQGQLEQGGKRKLISLGILVIFLASCLYGFNKKYLPLQKNNSGTQLIQTARVIQEITHQDDVILIYGLDWNPGLAYYSERRAVMDRSDLPVNHPSFQSMLTKLEDYHFGAMIVCRTARSEKDKIRTRATILGVISNSSYQNDFCDIYLSHKNVSSKHELLEEREWERDLGRSLKNGA